MSDRSGSLIGFALLLAVVLAVVAPGSGRSAVGTSGPLPLLGVADPASVLMGAATTGEPGETWGFRRLPQSVGTVTVGSRRLDIAGSGPAEPQLAFLRYTDGSGWQVFDLPVDENGNPYRGPIPNPLSARITATGGGVLVGRDLKRPVGQQVVVLHHDPGKNWRALPAPPADVLRPVEGEAPAETLADDQGSGGVAVAAFDESGHTGLLFGPQSRSVTDRIVHYDGTNWEWEPVEIPLDSEGRFRILAVDATGLGNAWALALPDDETSSRSLVLLERTVTSEGPLWVERPLAGTPFAASDTPGNGIAAAGPIGGASQPLTVTSDGSWIDLTATIAGVSRDVTLFYDSGTDTVTGTWCDAEIEACDLPLGAKFSRQGGYRSFAWPGGEFGTRVITNPLQPGGGEESNHGTYLRFADGEFERMPGGGASFRASGAFADADRGWLEGPVEISAATPPSPPRPWPLSLRAPLTDVTPAPGASPGSLDSAALAVGADGSVARYKPGRGWQREFLLSSSGSVNKASLRGVAWPERRTAYAVGDVGAMWQWNAADELWVQDPGVPIGFEGHLLDIAFEPGNPDRGYAVGKNGVLLSFGKSWDPTSVPAGFESASLTSIAFAGSQAIVAAGGDLLVNDGGAWRVDASAHALLESVRSGNPQLFAIAGLPDGGAVAAGRDIVIERDSASSPWRFSSQPLLGSTAIAAAAVRDGGSVRAVVSVLPQLGYPPADDLPEQDPTLPPPIPPPFALPGDGYLLRETANGWQDEQRTAFASSSDDRPLKSDPVLSLPSTPPATAGRSVAGAVTPTRWGGEPRPATRPAARSGPRPHGDGLPLRLRLGFSPGRRGIRAVPMSAGPSASRSPATPSATPLARTWRRTRSAPIARLSRRCARSRRCAAATGREPCSTPATGSRPASATPTLRATRNCSAPSRACRSSPRSAPTTSPVISEPAFSARLSLPFPAPFGSGRPLPGISTAGIPGAAPAPGAARTHYAFDSSGPGGTVRVVVIDNSLGSLAASDSHQNPRSRNCPGWKRCSPTPVARGSRWW